MRTGQMEQIQRLSDKPSVRQARMNYIAFGVVGTIVLALILGFCLALVAIINSGGALNPLTHLLPLPLITTIYGLIAIQINLKYQRHIVGWLLMTIAFMMALTFLTASYMEFEKFVLQQTGSLISIILNWTNSWVWFAPTTIPLTLLLLYFPDGTLPSPKWRPIAILIIVGILLGTLVAAFHPDSLPDDALMTQNPLGLNMFTAQLELLIAVSTILLIAGILGSIASLIVRYRRATKLERKQLKWLIYSAFCTIGMLVIWNIFMIIQPESQFVNDIGLVIAVLGIILIGITMGVAILKHQLWDVDILINKTLVYSILSVITVAIYLIVVTFFSTFFDGNSLLFSLIATGLVAVSFHTVRDRVQHSINHLMFGHRDDPYVVLERLSKRLEPVVIVNEVLPTIVRSIGEALQLPYVALAIWQNSDYDLVAVYPPCAQSKKFDNLVKLPLDIHLQHIGQLWLAPREQDSMFSATERNLLETVARQASVAAYNVRLTNQLQRYRQELVNTREEERRRLRRDLHDGLGPVLAAMSFRLDAIHNLADQDTQKTKHIAGELKDQVQSSLAEVRRIAYNLRPPALDELGLIGALREHLTVLEDANPPQFMFDAPANTFSLPAAVEVAAYRITLEAITNVQRHANATMCQVTVKLNDTNLQIAVIDNGKGITNNLRSGVGLNTMRERTEELGGHFIITNQGYGTRVEANLPL